MTYIRFYWNIKRIMRKNQGWIHKLIKVDDHEKSGSTGWRFCSNIGHFSNAHTQSHMRNSNPGFLISCKNAWPLNHWAGQHTTVLMMSNFNQYTKLHHYPTDYLIWILFLVKLIRQFSSRNQLTSRSRSSTEISAFK